MKFRVSAFGNNGLHIVVQKKLGFQEGQAVDIFIESERELDGKIRKIAQEEISKEKAF